MTNGAPMVDGCTETAELRHFFKIVDLDQASAFATLILLFIADSIALCTFGLGARTMSAQGPI